MSNKGKQGRGPSRKGHGTARPSTRRGGKPEPAKAGGSSKPARKPKPVVFDAPKEAAEPRRFRLGVIPGATPGKWISIWRDRMPDVPLELVHLVVADQREAILRDEVDAALIRRPLAHPDLRAFDLYEEVPVVVASADSALTAAEVLTEADLAGEVVLVPEDDVLRLPPIPATQAPQFAAPRTTEDAIAVVASGVGVVIVPMSLARLHHRKDVTFRPLAEGAASTVALAWHADRETADVAAFIGIVRGRTANSSRD